jgi:hypothetical protein
MEEAPAPPLPAGTEGTGATAGTEVVQLGAAEGAGPEGAGAEGAGAPLEGAGEEPAPAPWGTEVTTAGAEVGTPELAGQLVTVGPQEVMVTSSVS